MSFEATSARKTSKHRPLISDRGVTWGRSQRLICGRRMNSYDIVLGAAHIPKQGYPPLHRHAPAEFCNVTSGSGHVKIDASVTAARSGRAIFTPGNAAQGIIAGQISTALRYSLTHCRFGGVV